MKQLGLKISSVALNLAVLFLLGSQAFGVVFSSERIKPAHPLVNISLAVLYISSFPLLDLAWSDEDD